MLSIGIVDDSEIFRLSFKSFLNTRDGYEVVIDAASGDDLLNQLTVQKKLPNIIFMDVRMKQTSGIEVTKSLKKNYPIIKVIGLSNLNHDFIISGMISAGATGFLTKNIEVKYIDQAVDAVLNNQYFIEESFGKFIISENIKRTTIQNKIESMVDITNRQNEFLRLCVSNLTYKEIADKMSISIKTVDNHRDHLFNKLNINTRVELVIFAIQTGMTEIIL